MSGVLQKIADTVHRYKKKIKKSEKRFVLLKAAAHIFTTIGGTNKIQAHLGN